jgi:hypothetical protein
VAGAFYPADAFALEQTVDELLAQATASRQEPIALIVPHAGYIYSGGVAAAAFKQIEGRQFDVLVVLGTNHSAGSFQQIAIWPSGAYSTPLGLMPIDSDLAQTIIACDPQRIIANPAVQLAEHSIEVELPFIMRTLGPMPFVPIMIGEPSAENCQALSKALAQALQGRRALIVASTDMSHYPSYDDAVQADASTLLAICSMEPAAVERNTRVWMMQGTANLFCTLCGEGPVAVAMLTARELGANRATVLSYANSGNVPYGDKDQVVGYGAIMFWKGETPMLGEEDRTNLLRIARQTLGQYLQTGTTPEFAVSSPALLETNGAFVTLKSQGQLRGCIGRMTASQELYRTVQEMAIAAAAEDPRFPAVRLEELEELTIEISVLFPLEYVSNVGQIEIGSDGLYVSYGPFSGVLLPQVATEQGWDREEFLRQVCLKAGLPADAWQKGAILYRFKAQVFAEKD